MITEEEIEIEAKEIFGGNLNYKTCFVKGAQWANELAEERVIKLAEAYADFCLVSDREGLLLLDFESWLKLCKTKL